MNERTNIWLYNLFVTQYNKIFRYKFIGTVENRTDISASCLYTSCKADKEIEFPELIPRIKIFCYKTIFGYFIELVWALS